jgi:lipid-A-disaccharide synthase
VEPFPSPKPYIALLPGSRRAEVENILPAVAKLPSYFPEWTFYVAKVPHLPESFYRQYADLPLVEGQTHALLRGAAAAVVTSGTATLEAALLGCPSVIVYKGSWLSYYIARQLVRVPFIGLPNLIAEKSLFPELIQGDCVPDRIASALQRVLSQREAIKETLGEIQARLGSLSASEEAAKRIASHFRPLSAG